MQKGVNIVFEFLSTPSARRATCSGRRPRPAWTDFYPRPPRGGRHGVCAARHDSLLFLSTPSARRATQHSRFCYVVIQFLSTPSARRATGLGDKWFQDHQISIHALREEGDQDSETNGFRIIKFLSTPSARRATRTRRQMVSGSSNFYPRPPRGGRPSTPGFATLSYNFYPRPPRGGRQDSETNGFRIIKFLSTPSARRATRTRRQMVSGSSNFYPRPPRGGRPLARLVRADGTLFLSTPSARRATRMHHG